MSWVKVEGREAPLADEVRVAVRGVSKANPRPYFTLTIGIAVAEKMGINKGTRVDMFFGSGKDDGWIRIAHSERGRITVRRMARAANGCLLISSGRMPEGSVRERHATDAASYIIAPDRALEVRMPGWFWTRYEKKFPEQTHRGRPKNIDKKKDENCGHKPVDIKQNGHLTV